MESIKRSVKVPAPVGVVYRRWARVENFPLFMNSLREVRRIGEKQFYWQAERDGLAYEAVEEIMLKIPNQRIAWRNVSGSENSGVVSFEALGPKLTRVTLELAYMPDSGWHDPATLAERIEETLETFRRLLKPKTAEKRMVMQSWRAY